jgi:hypothetical protein
MVQKQNWKCSKPTGQRQSWLPLHELSECVGFVHGFKAVSYKLNRKITDAQINQIY